VDETSLIDMSLDTVRCDRETGLSETEAELRRARYGPNTTPEPPPRGLPRQIAAQLRDPLVLLLLAAMVVTVALRDVADAIVIVLVVVVNTTVGVIQEARADRAVAALRRLAAPTARVRRGGQDRTVPAAEVVPGDLIRLDAGDIVPADLVLIEAVRLQVDESTLTGEAVAAAKSTAPDEGDAATAHAGTVVVAGRGVGVAVRTGASSALGRIAALVAAEPVRRTPLQRRLATLSWILGLAALAARGDGGHRDQPDRRRRTGVAAGGGDRRAGDGGAPDGAALGDRPELARRGDPGLRHRGRRRQDRDADRRADDGRAAGH